MILADLKREVSVIEKISVNIEDIANDIIYETDCIEDGATAKEKLHWYKRKLEALTTESDMLTKKANELKAQLERLK